MTSNGNDGSGATMESRGPGELERSRVPRFLLEGLVIVVSVLLALAADAWWDGVQERETGRTYVRQLEADLVRLDQVVGAWLTREQVQLASTVKLLEYVDSDGGDLPPDSIQAWWLQSWASPSEHLSDGTLRDLVGSGSLRVIENDSLRTLLSSFVRIVDDTQARLTQLESNFSLLIADPFFQARVGLWAMYSGETSAARGIPSGERFSVDFEEIRHDREFANIILRGYVYKRSRVAELRRLTTATELLRAALESESRER